MNSWNQGGIFNDNSGQRIMSPQQRVGLPNTTPYNANYPQNVYTPSNGQQFYPSQGALQGHAGYLSSQGYLGPMSSVPQHYRPTTPQPQPFKQMTQAGQVDIRKKKNFEDQQRRLLALKQKGGPKTQKDNPLKNMFGNKDSSFNTSSLLGPLGNAPKDINAGFQGSMVHSQITSGFIGANTGSQPVGLPVVTTKTGLQAQNLQSLNILPQTDASPRSRNLQDIQGFTKEEHLQDDFGDFQQSAAPQLYGNINKPLSQGSLSTSGTSAVFAINQDTGMVPGSGAVGSGTITTSDSSKMNQEENISQAAVTPSIEEMMKKSLVIDKQSQSSVMKFQKPKLPKLIKSQPSHFSESSKASKWDNLESLSEIFTIPQPAVVQPEPVNSQSQPIVDSSDDWSDFSGADQNGAIFREQSTPGFTQGSLDHTQTKFEYVPLDSKLEGLQGKGLPGMSDVLLNSGTQIVQSDSRPVGGQGTQGLHGLDMMSGVQNLPVSQVMKEDLTVTRDEVLPEGAVGIQQQNQGLEIQEVDKELSPDPEKQLYGVQLPEWSQGTALLPAVYKQIQQICSNGSTSISTSQLYPILLSSDLPREKLGHIWSQCNKAVLGQLNQQELNLILGMVALAQAGLQVNKLTLEKLASCKTAPIPSFPEKIFQNDADSRSSAPSPQTHSEYETLQEHDSAYNNETGTVLDPSVDSNNLSKHSSLAVNAVKQPDWSKWKTTKAGHIDDKFADFRVLMPKEHSGSFQGLGSPAIPNANFNTAPVISNSMDSFGSFQTSAVDVQVSQASGLALPKNPLNVHMSTTALSKSTSMLAASETPSTREANLFQTHGGTTDAELSQDLNQAFSTPNTSIDSANAFGDFTSASDSVPEPQMSTVENKTPPSSAHFMSVPLQVSQRYALSGEDESVDHHEKAWLKCLTSCFAVIMKSCQILQTISDPDLQKEIFTSPQGISHFSAIIEIYCISRRVKASVMKSAPNNKKLKESLQNIDNVWKTCLGFQSFKELLPAQSLNFSECHVNEDEDLNLTCGVCLLNVDKTWVNSLINKGRNGKLSYGSRFYHTTCANFWCNKVDSVLPALQLNVGNSLI